jgi:hypothetical protein
MPRNPQQAFQKAQEKLKEALKQYTKAYEALLTHHSGKPTSAAATLPTERALAQKLKPFAFPTRNEKAQNQKPPT